MINLTSSTSATQVVVDFKRPHQTYADKTAVFERAGFEVLAHTWYHYQLKRPDALVDLRPSKNKFMAFGRVFCSSPERVVEHFNAGRLTVPDDAKPVDCKYCGEQVFFIHTKRGKWLPVERDGANHVGRCRKHK